MDKESIRAQMRERRHEVTEEERRSASRAICDNLLESRKIGLFLSCWRISAYLSTACEISTRRLVGEFWNASREVCVPVWNAENQCYDLSLLSPGVKLVKGPLGIREPVVRLPVPAWEVDAFIIPGLAFDMYGGRLGFGAGFYDKILAKRRHNARLIALCHDWQVIEDQPIPQEPHDVRMHWIVTEKRVIKCGLPPKRRDAPDAAEL
jgi:5-formyltetrahydrofolate cyclo-ligase